MISILDTYIASENSDSFSRSYDDGGPNLALCLEAQQYYKQHSQKTRVKAAGLLTIGEAKQLAGVTSLTIAPELLQKLSETQEELAEAARESIFTQKEVNGSSSGMGRLEPRSYLNDETAYREAFARSYGGQGEVKTKQVRFSIILISSMRDCRGAC